MWPLASPLPSKTCAGPLRNSSPDWPGLAAPLFAPVTSLATNLRMWRRYQAPRSPPVFRVIDLHGLSGHPLSMTSDKSPFAVSGKTLPRRNRGSLFSLLTLLALACGGAVAQADWPESRAPWGEGRASARGNTKPLGLPL